MTPLVIAVCAAGGAAAAAVLACVPGLHVYTVMGLLVLALHGPAADGAAVPPPVVIPLMSGLIAGYALLNSVPAVLLGAPDESALFTVRPGRKYLALGRGREAALLTAAGGLAALCLLVPGLGLLGPRLLPVCGRVLQPHRPWILWCVIAFMLLSGRPGGGRLGQGGLRRLLAGWRRLGVGLATFVLCGLYGFMLLYRTPVAPRAALQNLVPALVGLFTVPGLLLNIARRAAIPGQARRGRIGLPRGVAAQGLAAGMLGGGFAAFFPAVTGGVGGFLAGHAAGARDDRAVLVAQGASKAVYYAGGYLLLCMPYFQRTHGGGWLPRGVYVPETWTGFYTAGASVAIGGAAAFLLFDPLVRLTLRLLRRPGSRRLSAAALAAAAG
ncbi:MAG: tripartite tricarboxylate transporter permease, partial [Lentisphaerae bacterium]|nr:tripartite tricarboxylate transporter permease [Lentisphaerota bacterium]